MPEGVKHTTAAEVEAFLGKPVAAQLLEIWLNGKETNGSVAYAFKLIDDLGHDQQKIAIAFSEHVEPHLSAEEMEQLEQAGIPAFWTARNQTWQRVEDLWKWFTAVRALAILAIPIVITVIIRDWIGPLLGR